VTLALVADWLPTLGGAEHVIASLRILWPDAPLFTTVAAHKRLGELGQGDIRTVPFLQRLFKLTGRHQWLLPLLPKAVEGIDLRGYDVIVSSSHAVAKGIIAPATSVHICYCHTPMRYAWEMEAQYLQDFRIRWPLSIWVRAELRRLRRWDMSTAKRVDHFIANSSETKRRIARIYGRDSIVIPPPVEKKFFSHALDTRERYYLAIGRLVPYKRFDLLIELANRMSLPLKIGGSGPDLARLRSMAGPTVEFLGHVPDAEMTGLYGRATALLFPQIEDAGIVPLEALACGTPVIALAQGGVLDVIEHGVTGVLVRAQTVDAFAEALEHFLAQAWDHERIRTSALRFHEETFRSRIKEEVEKATSRCLLSTYDTSRRPLATRGSSLEYPGG
jgi:glycosyltransferase involved in cell wall biosynthesis